MAQYAAKPLNAVEENLQCGICLDTLRTAKTLPCLHSFCIECISKHINCNEDHGNYKCPTCIHEHPLPDGGAYGLPTDFTKVELCRIVRAGKIAGSKAKARGRMSPKKVAEYPEDGRASPRGCDICNALGKEESSHAVTACLDCTKMLCADCSEQHQNNEATKSHSVSDLKDQSSNVHCSKHGGDVLSHFCEPCSTFVCVICIHEEHHDHPCLDMTSVEHALRNRLIRTLKALNCDIKRLNEFITYTDEYGKSVKSLKRNICERAQAEKDLINRQREQLKKEIDEEAQHRIDAIESKEQDLLNRLDSLCVDVSKHDRQRDSINQSIKDMTSVNSVVRKKLKGADDGETIESDKTIPDLLKTGESLHVNLSLPSNKHMICAEFQPHSLPSEPFAEVTICNDFNTVDLGELFVKQIIKNGVTSSSCSGLPMRGSPDPVRVRHHSGPTNVDMTMRSPCESSGFQPFFRPNIQSSDYIGLRASTESMDINGPVRFSLQNDVGSVSPSDNYLLEESCPWQYVVKYGQLYDDCFMALHKDERIVVFKKSRATHLSDPAAQQWSIDYIRSRGHPLYEWLMQSVETRTNVLRESYHREVVEELNQLIEEYDGNHSEHSNDDSGW